MTDLYRPTFHQIFALRWREAGWDCARTCVQQAVEHVVALAPSAAADLSADLAAHTPEPAPVVEQSDLRYPLVRSNGLYPVPRRPPLCAAFYAYRDGTTLLLHLIWYFDGDARATMFAELQRLRWTGPGPGVTGTLGEDVLLSAVPMDGTAQAAELAAEMLAPFGSSEAPLVAFPLSDATLCLRQWDPPRREPWRAVLLFDRPEVQQNPAASRLALEEWPLVVLYRLRLDYLYLKLYREGVPPRLEKHGHAVQQALDRSFAGAGTGRPAGPHLLITLNQGTVQHGLARLAAPQFALLEALSMAEAWTKEAQRELRSLETVVQRIATTPLAVASPAPPDVEAITRALTTRSRNFVEQMEADVAASKLLSERADHGVEVLRTQATILGARYQRLLVEVVVAVGIGLAVGRLVDQSTAPIVYGRVRGWLPLLNPTNNPGALLVLQAISMVLGALVGWVVVALIIRLVGRFGRVLALAVVALVIALVLSRVAGLVRR